MDTCEQHKGMVEWMGEIKETLYVVRDAITGTPDRGGLRDRVERLESGFGILVRLFWLVAAAATTSVVGLVFVLVFGKATGLR